MDAASLTTAVFLEQFLYNSILNIFLSCQVWIIVLFNIIITILLLLFIFLNMLNFVFTVYDCLVFLLRFNLVKFTYDCRKVDGPLKLRIDEEAYKKQRIIEASHILKDSNKRIDVSLINIKFFIHF